MRLLTRALKELFSDNLLGTIRLAVASQVKAPDADCPICGFYGKFTAFGVPVRIAARCPRCGGLERHRLLALVLDRGLISCASKDVLNFAADYVVGVMLMKGRPNRYHTSNYPQKNGADFDCDIEGMDLPDESYDMVICSHVLKHVDDSKAFAELYRILRPGGSYCS